MMMVISRSGARRAGVIGLAVATAAIGAVTLAGPAHADFFVGMFKTKAACERERPKYKSSWTTPGPCYYYTANPPQKGSWGFSVDERY
ncbi:hypothetical protein [Nonomuraea rubra]|uniref:Uncharacterized protein n=1 Tax=Nonomuraea rubra TaxID=46180 RepID=A0A7X0U0P4_9ACTN|nr:hypothetical protein [Nonomuraea rubra]MBB6550589.1 hypothetical protein [Nonomuraea rubra]